MFINERLVPLARQPNSLVVHPHAQRTGGKTLRNRVLAAGFGREHVYSRMFRDGFKPWGQITEDDVRGYRAYTDLSNYCDRPLSRPCLPIALLRDPVHRAASLYRLARKLQTHELHALAMNTKLEDFYRTASSKNPRYFRNVQTARICNHADAGMALEYIMTRYLAVGFTSHIDAFANALSGIFGWSDVHVDVRPEGGQHHGQITPAFRDMVLAQNEEDRLLFDALMRGAPYRIAPQPVARQIAKRASRLRDRSLALMRGVQRRIGGLTP